MLGFTNTRESGLEALIIKYLVEQNGYEEGNNADYNKEYAIDEIRLFRFLQDTQPMQMSKLGVCPNHVHLYVSIPPKMGISEVEGVYGSPEGDGVVGGEICEAIGRGTGSFTGLRTDAQS